MLGKYWEIERSNLMKYHICTKHLNLFPGRLRWNIWVLKIGNFIRNVDKFK